MMTLWILVGMILTFCVCKVSIPCWLMMVMIIELIVTWLAARVKSERYVYNVIARDVHKNSEDESS